MKKFISFIVSSILIFNLVSVNVSAYSYSDYQTEVQKIIDEYGVFEQDEDLTYMFYGLIYAELIDFDNNGVEEMVCIYRHSLSNGGWERVADEGWASVVVYSVINGKLVSVFNAPLAASMLSSNPDYCIHYRMDNRKTYLIFDTVRENTVKNGINEKILIFTIDNEKPTCNILYGEALNFHEIGDVIYTKCMINDKMVSLEEYLAKQEWIHSEIRRISLLYHYYSEENEKHQHISYSKIVEFLNTLEQKSNAEIKVLLNGKKIDFDVLPVIKNERTLVPLRAIFESLGAAVEWNSDTQTITAYKDDITIVMTIGKNEMYVNENMVWLDVAPAIINSRTLVPVRAVAESFDCIVDWDANNNIIIIS